MVKSGIDGCKKFKGSKGTGLDMKIYKKTKLLKLQIVVKIAFVNKEKHSQTSVQRVDEHDAGPQIDHQFVKDPAHKDD